jgi:hypothetical protein
MTCLSSAFSARVGWVHENAAVLKEEFQPTDEDSARAIVEKIVARFLTPMLNAVCN